MFTQSDAILITMCLEWFLYGKTSESVLCALTCTLAKEVQIILRSRILFRNIRHVFATPTGTEQVRVQDGIHHFLRSLSSLRPIYCQRCR
jgi:hypothetical protein